MACQDSAPVPDFLERWGVLRGREQLDPRVKVLKALSKK